MSGANLNKKPLLNAFLYLFLLSWVLSASYPTVPAHAALSWNVQVVDANAADILGNGYCPFAVASYKMPKIAYTGVYEIQTEQRPRYASWNGSGWSIQEMPGSPTDLALNAGGKPHMLIAGGVLEPSSYASWTGTEWVTKMVPSTLNHNVVYASLALDSSGARAKIAL